MTKYKLPFVNEGKPFEIPNWTVEKHENALLENIVEDDLESLL